MPRRSLVLVLLLVACSSDTKKQMASGIGPSGGSVKLGDGTTVGVPAGALTAPTTITVGTTDPAATPAGTEPVGQTYVFGPEGQAFAQPVTVTLAVDPNQIPADQTIADVIMFTAPAASSDFTALTTTVADATHVSASVSHFSKFVPCVVKKDAKVDFSMQPILDLSIAPEADMTQVNPSADMSAPLTDMAGAALTDMAPIADGPCVYNYMSGGSGTNDCTMTYNCYGHAYQMYCSPAELNSWLCTCSTDGVVTSSFSGLSACALQVEQSHWKTPPANMGCGYP